MSYFGNKLCPALVSQQEQTKVDEMSQQQHKLLSKSAQKLDFTSTTNAAKLAGLYIEKMSFSSSTMLLCYNYYNYFMVNSWVKSCFQNEVFFTLMRSHEGLRATLFY